jgi:hypothetical protein
MSVHLPVEHVAGRAVCGLADSLGVQGAGGFGGLGAWCRAGDRQYCHPPSRCQPVGDPGLLARQVEPRFPDRAAEMRGAGLARGPGPSGEQSGGSRRGRSRGRTARPARAGLGARSGRRTAVPCLWCYMRRLLWPRRPAVRCRRPCRRPGRAAGGGGGFVRARPGRMVVRGSACRAATWTSGRSTPAPGMVVTKGVAEHVRVCPGRLHASFLREVPQAAGGCVPVHPGSAAAEQDRAAHPARDRAVDGPAGRGRQRDRDDLAAPCRTRAGPGDRAPRPGRRYRRRRLRRSAGPAARAWASRARCCQQAPDAICGQPS